MELGRRRNATTPTAIARALALPQEPFLFLRKWLRDPLSIAAVAPSSPALAAAMARAVPPGPGTVVELGGGTGAITRALLERGEAPVVVERDADFCALLTRRFPTCRVLKGDALALGALLAGAGVEPPVKAVISGLPLLSMPAAFQLRLLAQAFAVLEPGAPFVQFSYGLASPLKERVRRRLGLEAASIAHIWRNLPPARVWAFRRRDEVR
ncbi:MAG: methyltransferase [Porticoccaceae bacterium]|nr:MAG: methyltransferase [Porticoccaceae bacterium]